MEGLHFIFLLKKQKFYSTLSKIQDIEPNISHLVFCIFSLANSCFHTEEYFFA